MESSRERKTREIFIGVILEPGARVSGAGARKGELEQQTTDLEQ